MTYEIIHTAGTRFDLEREVRLRMAQSGGRPTGGPFYDGDSREWCQAIMSGPASEDVRLREPKRK